MLFGGEGRGGEGRNCQNEISLISTGGRTKIKDAFFWDYSGLRIQNWQQLFFWDLF